MDPKKAAIPFPGDEPNDRSHAPDANMTRSDSTIHERLPMRFVTRTTSLEIRDYSDGTRDYNVTEVGDPRIEPAEIGHPSLDAAEGLSTGTVVVNDHAASAAPNNLHATEETLEEKTERKREEIRAKQVSAAKTFRAQLMEEVQKQLQLPKYLFEDHLLAPREKQPENSPIVLELEIARAKAAAEINVYLTHCRTVKQKLKFLTMYQRLEDENMKTDTKDTMKDLANMNLERDESGEVVYHVPKPGKTNQKSGPKGAVHELRPMLPKNYILSSDPVEEAVEQAAPAA